MGGIALGYLAEYTTHDLATTGARQTDYDLYLVRSGESSDHSAYMVANVSVHGFRVCYMTVADDVGIDTLTLDIVRIGYHCAFYYSAVYVDRIFELAGTDAVTRYIDHIVYTTCDTIVAV